MSTGFPALHTPARKRTISARSKLWDPLRKNSSGLARVVTQSFTLLYRRFSICSPHEIANTPLAFSAWPTGSRRYSRVKLCVTGDGALFGLLSIDPGLGVNRRQLWRDLNDVARF